MFKALLLSLHIDLSFPLESKLFVDKVRPYHSL